MGSLTGADIILDYLIDEDVPYLFGLTGHGIIGLLEGLHDRKDKIKAISVHHEGVAGFMADAYFRVAHRPVATFTSCGPGSAQLVVSLANAMMDASAFLAITGNVPTTQFNRAPFQETGHYYQGDFPQVIRSYVKRSFQPTRIDMLPNALHQAFNVMTSGRYGPVNLDVPLNIFQESLDLEETPIPHRGTRAARGGEGDPESIERTLDLLRNAERPLIVAGRGVLLSEASDIVIELAAKMNIPVACSPEAKDAIDEGHPVSVGVCGRNGAFTANQACRSSDVILALGVSFDDRATSSWMQGVTYTIPPTKLIQVDVDSDEIGRNYPVEVPIIGDEKLVVSQLLRETNLRSKGAPNDFQAWWGDIKSWRETWVSFLGSHADSAVIPIRPERLVADLRSVLPKDTISLSDVGIHHNWLVQRFQTPGPLSLMSTWGFGSMGFGVCGVLGAKLAAPDRPAVCICGDGGFLMNAHVVVTAVEYNIPAVWVVWNNRSYASIGGLQRGVFNREILADFAIDATGEPHSADFAAMAKSFGADGIKVEKPADFAPALETALKANKPFVLDVGVEHHVGPAATGGWELPPSPPFMPSFQAD